MQITKGKLLEILNNIDPDPQLLARIVTDCMKRLPDAYSWQLSHQLYMQYYWEGPVYTVTNNLTGVSRKFGTVHDIVVYLNGLGYSNANPKSVGKALRARSSTAFNHTFDREDEKEDEEKEITYL